MNSLMKNKYLLSILLLFNGLIATIAQTNCINTPSVSLNLSGLCAGKSEQITATPTNGGATPFYIWKLNNAVIPIFNNITTDAGLSDNNINEVYASGNNLYIATTIGLNISINSGSTFSNKTKAENGLGNDLVNGLFVTANGVIYAATAGGLSISTNNGALFSNKTTANGLGSNIVNDVFVDGTIIYAATNNGLSISNDGGLTFTNKTIGSTKGVFVDGNNIYVATSVGLSISTDGGANFNLKTTTDGLGSNIVNDVYKVGNRIYAATSNGLGISINNGTNFTNKTLTNGLGSNNVMSVFAIGSFVYVSTINGLSLSNNNGDSFFGTETIADGLGTNILNYTFSSGNNIYAATTGGLGIATINILQINDAKANDQYSVTMLPSSEICQIANPVSTTLTIAPLPIPNITTNAPICSERTLNLNANNVRNNVGNTFSWTGPNSYSSTEQNLSFPEATVNLSGTYKLTITDANRCTATATTNITIKPKPPIPTISVPSQLFACVPNTLTLTANGCAGTVTWSDNSSGSTLTLSTIGTYSVYANCKIDGCVSESSAVSSGLEIRVAPTAQASNNGPFIVGQTINLGASNGPNYSWSGPNNFSSLVSSPTISKATLQNAGIYTVLVSINGCTATATTNVVVENYAPCASQRILDYSYVKAGNPHQTLFPLSNGMAIQQIADLSTIIVTPVCPTVNIESVEMKIVGPELNHLTVQNIPFYALFNNEGEDVYGRYLTPGEYTLTVTGYDQDDRNGAIVYGPVVTTFNIEGTLGKISIPTIPSQSICAGSNIDVNFSTTGNFTQVSQFQVQLSDINGSFENPITIGTSSSIGTVSCFIPTNIPTGSNYLIRVATSNQKAVGDPTNSFIKVNPVNSNITQDISLGTITNKVAQSLSANNKIIAPANVNYQAGKAISLDAGFEARSGSVFKAEIKTCNN